MELTSEPDFIELSLERPTHRLFSQHPGPRATGARRLWTADHGQNGQLWLCHQRLLFDSAFRILP